MSESKKQVEKLAKKLGVSLAVQTPAPEPQPGQDDAEERKGFMRAHMPAACPIMDALRKSLPAPVWAGAMANLKLGRGYVVDLTAGLAVGTPPVAEFELGKSAERDGYKVTRVRPKVLHP